jgi:hypothetical protein
MMILIPVFLCIATSALADGVFLEGGQGIFHSTDSQAVFLSYQRDSSPFFGLDSFYKVALGSWNGRNRNDAIILAKGIWWNLSGKSYFCFEPGGAYITETTHNLGTHLQFAFRFALGMRTEKIDLSVGYRHFSNGKGIFHWTKTQNFSDNFLTLQIGYLL